MSNQVDETAGAGERSAISGYSAQYQVAARLLLLNLRNIEWIKVADPEAGPADDFQYFAAGRRHALQVKWSQYGETFTWSDFAGSSKSGRSLVGDLAAGWKAIRSGWSGPLTVHLWSNRSASTSPATGSSPLARARADGGHHLAAFIATSVQPVLNSVRNAPSGWASLRQDPLVAAWGDAWDALLKSSGLADDEFAAFIGDLELNLSEPLQSALAPDDDTHSRDVGSLAALLQKLVADPARPVQIHREELLASLGWSERLRYRHPHRFPRPLAYEANDAAVRALSDQLDLIESGYIALVGPAGCGKSTLLESLDAGSRVVHYYAYVPDSVDAIGVRGEASNFLHDICLALDELGTRRLKVASDLSEQRDELRHQLEVASRTYAESGEKTVVIVDGLDHIAREQNPERSFVLELPSPASLGPGVVFVLGTQRTDILPSEILRVLNADGATVEVKPLGDDQVLALLNKTELETALREDHKARFVEVSEGHPLAITYMISQLVDEAHNVDEVAAVDRFGRVLDSAAQVGGDLAARYEGYLAGVPDLTASTAILGAICRLRVPVNLDWLKSWAEADAVNDFVKSAAYLFHREGAEWRFVHNSFRLFLVEHTATVAGEYSTAEDQRRHAELAGICARSAGWAMYAEEELEHRLRSGDLRAVVDSATPTNLRQRLRGLAAPSVIRRHAGLALVAAATLEDYEAWLSLLLFGIEFEHSLYVLEPKHLANELVGIGAPQARSHIVSGSTLLVELDAAFAAAVTFLERGELDTARSISRAAGELGGILSEFDGHYGARRAMSDVVADWCEVRYGASGLDATVGDLDRLIDARLARLARTFATGDPADGSLRRAQQDLDDRKRALSDARLVGLARCHESAVQLRNQGDASSVEETLAERRAFGWLVRAKVVRAQAALEDRDVQTLLDLARELRELVDGLATESEAQEEGQGAVAEFGQLIVVMCSLLAEVGRAEGEHCTSLWGLCGPIAFPASIDTDSDQALRDYSRYERVRRLRSGAGGARSGRTLAGAEDTSLAGLRRLQSAVDAVVAYEVSSLLATAHGSEPPSIEPAATEVARLLNVDGKTIRDWRGWISSDAAVTELYVRLFSAALRFGGEDHFAAAMRRFSTDWSSPNRRKYWFPERRLRVIQVVLDTSLTASEWAYGELGSACDDIEGSSSSSYELVEAWLKAARAAASLRDDAGTRGYLAQAVDASWRLGARDDDTMLVDSLRWLETSSRSEGTDAHAHGELLWEIADRFTQNPIVIAESGGEAAGKLAELLFRIDPAGSLAFAEHLCDLGAFEETGVVAALVRAGLAEAGVDPALPALIYAHILLPISPYVDSETHSMVHGTNLGADLSAVVARAEAMWLLTVPGSPRGSVADTTAVIEPRKDALPATAVLNAMRRAEIGSVPEESEYAWESAIRVHIGGIPFRIAEALLAEAKRLGLNNRSLGVCAAAAAVAGSRKAAEATLSEVMSAQSPYEWHSNYGSHSRMDLLRDSLEAGERSIAQLGVFDLAESVAYRKFRGGLSSGQVLELGSSLVGASVVAGVASYINSRLREVLPNSPQEREPSSQDATTHERALVDWVSSRLGHPVRDIDFGSRAVLGEYAKRRPLIVDAALTTVLDRGGWTAEAALAVLRQYGAIAYAASPGLIDALSDSCQSPDAFVASAAAEVLSDIGQRAPERPARKLAPIYALDMPPLPPSRDPLYASSGAPILDLKDPRHVLAPYDYLFPLLSEATQFPEEALLRHASNFTSADYDSWTKLGPRNYSQRLEKRGTRLTYRPWAFAMGRRGLGRVMADLSDAELGTEFVRDIVESSKLDVVLNGVDTGPLTHGIPVPSEKPDDIGYGRHAENWVDEVDEWLPELIESTRASTELVLGERSSWDSLRWDRRRERREISAFVPAANRAPRTPRWSRELPADPVDYGLGDRRVPFEATLSVAYHAMFSDAVSFSWFALNPEVGRLLGWVQSADAPLEWRGADGEWRAQSRRHVRGQAHHPAPRDVFCADVWRVILSEKGAQELRSRCPTFVRGVYLGRELPGNGYNGREAPYQRDATTLI